MLRKIELCLAFLVCVAGAYAQPTQGYGAVLGTVRDPYGDGIPDTKVVLMNTALGFHRDMMTTDDGLFSAPNLTPSRGYVIAVTRKNFGDWTSTQFEVHVGEALNFIIPLKNGSTAVRATAESALFRISQMDQGIPVEVPPAQMEALPADYRRIDPLLILGPYSGRETRTGRSMFLGEARFNQFYLDGFSTPSTNTPASGRTRRARFPRMRFAKCRLSPRARTANTGACSAEHRTQPLAMARTSFTEMSTVTCACHR